MAHIGKLGPVHLRRDLCIACTNYTNAIPQVFQMAWSWVVSGSTFYTNGTFPTIVLAHPVDENAWPPVWESDPITQHGKTWHFRIEFDGIDIPTQRTRLRFFAMDGSTVVIEGTGENNALQNCGSFSSTSNWVNVSFDTTFWGGTGGFIIIRGDLATWSLLP